MMSHTSSLVGFQSLITLFGDVAILFSILAGRELEGQSNQASGEGDLFPPDWEYIISVPLEDDRS